MLPEVNRVVREEFGQRLCWELSVAVLMASPAFRQSFAGRAAALWFARAARF